MDRLATASLDTFRWPVRVRRQIASPSTDVWRCISIPGILERCHPFCRANPVFAWPGTGSRDEVHYHNGLVYERRFLEWIEGRGYSLEIGERGGATSIVTWEVAPVDASTSTLRITIRPHVLQDLPTAIRWLPHLAFVQPRLRRYLDSVLLGFDWYLTHHEPVRRNQFGPHPWFSPAE